MTKKRKFTDIYSSTESESESSDEEPPKKRLRKSLGKLPNVTQLRIALNKVYQKLGPLLKEIHYQSALQAYLEDFHNLEVIKEYPLKFKVYGIHIGYKKRSQKNDTELNDDGKFYNYIDLLVKGSNGNIIIECKKNEIYKPNIDYFGKNKIINGRHKPSDETYDQIQRYHELLYENDISYKSFYLMNFPAKKRAQIEKHYVMKIPCK